MGQQKKSSKLTKNPIKTKTFFELEKKPKKHGKSFFFFLPIYYIVLKKGLQSHITVCILGPNQLGFKHP